MLGLRGLGGGRWVGLVGSEDEMFEGMEFGVDLGGVGVTGREKGGVTA